jgi:hypothetical protein
MLEIANRKKNRVLPMRCGWIIETVAVSDKANESVKAKAL